MYLEIRIDDLMAFVTDAVDAGVQAYIRETEPQSDSLNKAAAKKYVKKLGFAPYEIDKWVQEGLLHPVKAGDAQNSALRFSLAEIKKVISTLKLKKLINTQNN